MPKVTRTTSHVTAEHIRYVAAVTNNKVLADTTDGIALVNVNNVLTDGSTVTRVLLGKADIRDAASALSLTVTQYLDLHATAIAAELNQIRTGKEA